MSLMSLMSHLDSSNVSFHMMGCRDMWIWWLRFQQASSGVGSLPLKELPNQLPNVSRLLVPMVPPRLMHFFLLHKDGALAYLYAQWLSIVDFKESPWSLCLLSHPVKRRSVDQSIKYGPSMVLISSDRLEVKILMAPDGSWGVSKNFLVLGHLERSLASQKWSRPLAVASHQLHV